MIDDVKIRINKELALKIAFIVSEIIILFAISVFRTKRMFLFLAIHFGLFSFFFLYRKGKCPFPFVNKNTYVVV